MLSKKSIFIKRQNEFGFIIGDYYESVMQILRQCSTNKHSINLLCFAILLQKVPLLLHQYLLQNIYNI